MVGNYSGVTDLDRLATTFVEGGTGRNSTVRLEHLSASCKPHERANRGLRADTDEILYLRSN